MKLENWNIGSLRLSGLRQGEGPLLVMLHGFPAYHKSWEAFIPAFSGRFQVVVPDLRGYYESDKPRGVNAYATERLLEDLARLIRYFDARDATLVGHDWGGAIAWTAASRRPRLVRRLAVLNCPHPAALIRHLKSDPAQRRRSWYILFFQLPWLPEYLIRKNSHRWFRLAFGKSVNQEDLEQYRRAFLKPGVATASINYYRAAGRALLDGLAYPKVSCPTLLLWGDRDHALGSDLAETSRSFCRGPITVKHYHEAGHWLHDDLPEEVTAELDAFLET